MFLKSILFRKRQSLLLFIGTYSLCVSVFLIATASQTSIITAENDIIDNWRSTYDLLVRPIGSTSLIEERYNLVEANHLSSISGGISFEDLALIRTIPGVEIAAPISMIGIVPAGFTVNSYPFPSEPGVYAYESRITEYDGINESHSPEYPRLIFYYFDRNPQEMDSSSPMEQYENIIVNIRNTNAEAHVSFPLLLAGIDPQAEAALMGLENALVSGEYLIAETSLENPLRQSNNEIEEGAFDFVGIRIPVMINSTEYLNISHSGRFWQINLPDNVDTIDEILMLGGVDYLLTLPTQILGEGVAESDEIYPNLLLAIAPQLVGGNSANPALGIGFSAFDDVPSRISYQEITPPFEYDGLVFEIVSPDIDLDPAWPQYRESQPMIDLNFVSWLNPVGLFNIENIQQQMEINQAPDETYFPPVNTLLYDEFGIEVNPPTQIIPTSNINGFIQPPPLLLTTLAAAQALRGDEAISAIRIRLNGFAELSPNAAQRRIETIAIQIAESTGLEVDIMGGSSPRRILVHVPGIGYVEEQWIQKGVNLSFSEGIQTGHLLLLGTLFISGGLYVLDLAWGEVATNRRTISLLKALGWFSKSIFFLVLGQILLISIVATLVGSLSAIGVAHLLNMNPLPTHIAIAIPIITILLSGIGGFFPALLASNTVPIIAIQQAGVRPSRRLTIPNFTIHALALNQLIRRPMRIVLTGMTTMVSSALLVLLLNVIFEQQGMFSGVLLGEFILVHIRPFHFAIIGMGFSLSAFSSLNGLLNNIRESKKEIGILKAVGWETGSLINMFISQGVILGLIGGIIGSALGGGVFIYFYGIASPIFFGILAMGILTPGLIGALVAIFPARMVASESLVSILRN